MGYIKLDKEVEHDISAIINDFSFYNSLFKKFANIFDVLKLELPTDKSHVQLDVFQKAYWTLFVLAHKFILDKRSDIVDSISLLGALFYWMLNSGHLRSNQLALAPGRSVRDKSGASVSGKQLIGEISRLLNLRDLGRFEHVLNDFANYLQTLRLQEILPEKWGAVNRIEVGRA